MQDLRFLQEDSSRRKASYLSELRTKDEELESLRSSSALASASREDSETQQQGGEGGAVSKSKAKARELEGRLAQLTESLLQKQALLEAVSAEKASLVLQIERMEVREVLFPSLGWFFFSSWKDGRASRSRGTMGLDIPMGGGTNGRLFML